MKRVACMMLAMASSVIAETKMVWKQDLSPAQLASIDKEDLNNPWNDQFKVPAEDFKHKKMRKRLMQGAGEVVEEVEVVDEGKCKISFEVDTRTDTYLITYGYIQGLYPSKFYPKDGCTRCEKTA